MLLPEELSFRFPHGAGSIAGRESKHDQNEEEGCLALKQRGCSAGTELDVRQYCMITQQ